MSTNKTSFSSWAELGNAICHATNKCNSGLCQPVGTIEVSKLPAGLYRIVICADLLPLSDSGTSTYEPQDSDIPF